MNEKTQESEVLMENIQPEDLPTEAEKAKEEFIPSPKWKRVLAWVLFAIVVLGIASWLLNIAVPEWPEKLFGYTRG